jgi:hypothetical protein
VKGFGKVEGFDISDLSNLDPTYIYDKLYYTLTVNTITDTGLTVHFQWLESTQGTLKETISITHGKDVRPAYI